MRVAGLILKELWHRKINSLLILFALAGAVMLYVGFYTTGTAADKETTRLMRDLGFNLRIIPREADAFEMLRQGYSTVTMPEEYAERFMNQPHLSYEHLTLTLKRWITIGDNEVLLTGIKSQVSPRGVKKKPMVFQMKEGTVYLGFHVATRLGLKKGDTLELGGLTLTVDQTLSETGKEDDITLFAHLKDAQVIAGTPGQINEIQAIECLCRDPDVDSIDILRGQLEEIMPEAKVMQKRAMAKSREKQRIMIENYFDLTMQAVLGICALWVAVLMFLNVRERRHEIGVLHALGYGAGVVGGLFLGKAIVLGVLGAVIGFGAGTLLAVVFGPSIFTVTAGSIVPLYNLLWQALMGAPIFAALCSLIPASLAVTQDPALVLREE